VIEYGACGTGAYCLGGCDPLSSHKLSSCVPAPVCRSQNYDFTSLDRIIPNTKYLGDASKADWVSSGSPVIYNNNVLLTMAPDTVGTLLASSTYMWYGNVKATFKTSRGAGVVTAFILLSDVKDEIDYEFVGVDLKTAQTNFYFQGITNCKYFGIFYIHTVLIIADGNSQNITLSDTFSNYHTYEIDWTPDKVTWLIDGQEGRTLERKNTWNSTTNQWMFPQTPARVQLSLWPGGLASNAKGTVDWAGGQIDWNGPDIKSNGYYYSMFQSVSVNCYNAKTAPGTNSGTSYTISATTGTNDTVVDGDSPTVLKSLLGSGENMNAGDPALLSTTTSGAKASATPTVVAQVPGLTGSGTGSDDHSGDSQGSGSSPAASGSSSNTATTAADTPASAPTSASNGQFNQGGGSNSGSGTAASGADKLGSQEKALKGSLFAGVVVLVAMMAL
jgi:beta-glucanase (GH16 family)